MRTIRDFFGRDLLHLAIILSLLRADVYRNNRFLTSLANSLNHDHDDNGGGGSSSYDDVLIRHKAVLDDLHDLGGSGRWFHHQQQPPSPVEISAYVLDTLQEFPDEGNSEEIMGGLGGSSSSSGGGGGEVGNLGGFLVDVEMDSGVSDVDTGSDGLSSAGGRSPSTSSVTSGANYEFNEDEGRVLEEEAFPSAPPAARSPPSIFDDLSLPEPVGRDPFFHDVSHSDPMTFDWSTDDLLGSLVTSQDQPLPPLENSDDVMRRYLDFDEDEEGVCTRDVNLGVTSQSPEPAAAATATASQRARATSADSLPSFAPDEEDVENQLMHIDDQLIRLDGSIDNINEGVDSLNGAIVAADEAAADEDEDSMMEALLGQDDQDFLFSSLRSSTSSSGGGANQDDQISGSDGGVFGSSPFDDLDDLVGVATLPTSPPTLEAAEPEPEKEIKQEEEESAANEIVKVEEESIITVKQEVVEPEEEESSIVDGATAQTPFFHQSQDSKLGILQFEQHLLDHNYAASFEDKIKVEHEEDEEDDDYFYSSSSESAIGAGGSHHGSPSYYLSAEYLRGAAASPALSSTSSSATTRFRESRDERKARAFGIPFTCTELIDIPMDKFNDLIASSGLSETQMSLCRDIRRRGKNKVAAQNCRRRKLDLISNLSEEIIRAREYKQQLLAEREQLYRMRNEWSNKLLQLEEQVLRGLDKSTDEYALTLMPNSQQVRLTHRVSSASGSGGDARDRRKATGASSSAVSDPTMATGTTARLAKPTRA